MLSLSISLRNSSTCDRNEAPGAIRRGRIPLTGGLKKDNSQDNQSNDIELYRNNGEGYETQNLWRKAYNEHYPARQRTLHVSDEKDGTGSHRDQQERQIVKVDLLSNKQATGGKELSCPSG